MTAERRWARRAKVRLDVALAREGVADALCRTRDIGLGGVFVELPRETQPLLHTTVELIFKLDSGTEITKHRVKAKVARLTAEGAGLMFRDFDANTFRSLQEILRRGQSAFA